MIEETDIYHDRSLQSDIHDVVRIEQALLQRHCPLPDLDEELAKIVGSDTAVPLSTVQTEDVSDEEEQEGKHTVASRFPLAFRYAASALIGAAAMLALVFAWQWLHPLTGSHPSVAQNQADAEGMACLETAEGESLTLTLADGTQVSLNAGSRLEYPHRFQGGERMVRLQGEAYFNVRHDARHPFVVDAGGVLTKDLGTAFNIRAFSSQDCRVTLVEGSVAVIAKQEGAKPVVLTPGQEFTLTSQTPQPRIAEVNTQETTAWVDGIYYYHDQTVEQVVSQLAHIYNKVAELRNTQVKDTHIDFSTSRTNTLQETITLLNELGIARFSVEGTHIVVE